MQLTQRRGLRFVDAAALLAVIAVLSTISLWPKTRTEVIDSSGGVDESLLEELPPDAREALGGQGGGSRGGRRTQVGTTGTGGAVAGPGGPGGPGGPVGNLQCAAGANGGATAPGVTGSSIKLGATVVESGIGSSFLGDVRWGMKAVVDRVNREGGVCGRQLVLLLKDDGWDASTGFQFIRDLVEGEEVFALAVVPSSEGLRLASLDGYLGKKGVTVAGSDGMLITQYTDKQIFPVAAATISAMHIVAKWGYDQSGGDFWPAIVYDARYRFGAEGAYAFNEAVQRLTGRRLRDGYTPKTAAACGGNAAQGGRLCGIQPDQPGYGTEAGNFNNACRASGDLKACNFTVFLLEPQTAKVWLDSGGRFHGKGAVPQPLFNRRFAEGCADRCTNVVAWTGYIPPIEGFENRPAVAAYVNELRAANERADRTNAFVQGGYVGMTLVAEALKQVGPNLTRPAFQEALYSLTLDTGLSRPLSWSPGNHFANRCMMGFELRNDGTRFTGYRLASDFTCDPNPALGIPKDQ